MRLIVIIAIFINSLLANTYIDSITFKKIEKLVQKEELIAEAYKKYIFRFGTEPNSLTDLKNSSFLPDGFTSYNYFGKQISIITNINKLNISNVKVKAHIYSELPEVLKEKVNIYEYYYSNKNRRFTTAPISSENSIVRINLSSKEKYILEFKDIITTEKKLAKAKYFLDENGVLHWYDLLGNYKFSYGKNLILDSSVTLFDEITGNLSTSFTKLFKGKKILYSGLEIFHMQGDKALEYIDLGDKGDIIKVGDSRRELGKTILKFTRRAGGMIVNGDIYTWGNNAKKVVGVGNDNYTTSDGTDGNSYAVINTLVKSKALTYDKDIDDKQYFSSPLRPKFVDFTSDVWHSTCGVSLKGELYCGGTDSNNTIEFKDRNKYPKEYLTKSVFFDGENYKIKKVFSLLATYIALGKEVDDSIDGYLVYYWGGNNTRGYGATGEKKKNRVSTPNTVSNIRFKDITYTLSVGYRKIAGLTTDGDIYTWGLDNNITTMNNCMQNTSKGNVNFCEPVELKSDINFTWLLGGQRGFVAKDDSGQFYRITQIKKSGQGTLPKVEKINDLIKSYDNYDESKDSEILSVDLSSKLSGSSLDLGEGIVWVNGNNELKGDYYTVDNINDKFFQKAVDKIKWKIIRVIEDQNGMCGIDINNQMYCWGDMTFGSTSNNKRAGNTFMLPMFTANLHDNDKDFLVVEGKGPVTTMTSSEWNKNGQYFIKYPTYFGGFNYEFEFK